MQAANGDTATSTGQIYTFIRDPTSTPPSGFLPQHLSATGAFQPDADGGIASMTPATALVPYTVNSPLWSDNALKKRWISLPNPSGHTSGFTTAEQVHFQPTGEWTFPTGTVFVKHFDLTVDEQTGVTRRLETRLLVRDAFGSLYGVTYKWRPDGLDAELLTSSVNEDIQVVGADGTIRTQTWYYPSRNDCLTCHNDNANHVLGVKTRQLNGAFTYPSGITDNQLRTWSRAGMFDSAVADATIGQLAFTVPITDTSSSLETRARSFLDSNCAHCHRPGGVHETSWDARFDTPLAQQGIVDVAATITIPSVPVGLQIVAHNDTTRSSLYLRDASLDPAIKMPPLAKNVVDDPAMTVLRSWIATLRAPATVTLGGLAQTYDGNPKAATASSSPASAFITITYGGSATPPINVGSYPVTASIDTTRDGDLSGSTSGTLVISKGTAGIVFGTSAKTYTGAAQSATVTTVPAGLSLTLLYNGTSTPPTNVGSYVVDATVVDANYVGAATGLLTIAPAAATVTLGALNAVYDGTAKAVTVTTVPPGLTTSVTYDGSATPPTNAHGYAVVATITDANHVGSATGTLTIARASATVTLGALSAVYDGSPKSASVTTVPAGLSTGLTYNGGATPPTNAGPSTVVATITDANHQGSATGTLTIAPASASVTLGALSAVYDGTPKSATVTTVPVGLTTSLTYNGGAIPPTNAGASTVVATITDANHQGSATGTLTIAPATASVSLGALDTVFDGSPKSVTVATVPAGLATAVTYDGSAIPPTNAHAYAVVATITDPNHFGSATGTLTIAAVNANITLGALNPVYDGAPKAVTVTTVPPGLPVSITYDGGSTPPTDARGYAVIATITDPNHPGSATGTLTIAPASATIAFGPLSAVYDGTAKSVTVGTVPVGLATAVTYDGSATPPTNARAYALVATITDPNHRGSATASFAITPASATVTLGALSAVYDGTPKAVTVTTSPPGLTASVVYDGSATPPTHAHAYGVVATLTDPNFQGTATGTLTIAQAPATVTLGALSAVYDGSAKPVTVTTVPAGLQTTIVYAGSPGAPTEVGTYAVTATIADIDYSGTASGTLTIGKGSAVVIINGPLSPTYSGGPQAVAATTVPPGLVVAVTYSGATTPPTGAGTYAVVATIVDAHVAGTTSATLTVAKAPLTVVAEDLVVTTGAPIPPLTWHLQGELGSDGLEAISGVPILATPATAGSPAGSYPITCEVSGVSSANYTVQGQNGILHVNGTGTTPPPASQPGGGSGGGSGCGAGSGISALAMALLLVLQGLRLGRGQGRRPVSRR
ncbi:MAG: hypothetical protein H0X38_06710 [Planctomycetes bacterium]|nr:hypothetical protein [Planctomycetota bacterium]